MDDKSWHQVTTWTPATAAEFNQRVSRLRDRKQEAFWVQASCLHQAGDHVHAEELALRALEEVKNMRPEVTVFLHVLVARIRFAGGQTDAAEAHLRAAIAAYPPTESHGRRTRLARIRAYAHPETILARVLHHRGRHREAAAVWASWAQDEDERLTWHHRWRWPARSITGESFATPEDAAEELVGTHHSLDHFDAASTAAAFAATFSGLRVICDLVFDRALINAPFWRFTPDNYTVMLGSYLGRVLVLHHGGGWIPAEAVLGWRVRIEDVSIDPFRLAFRFLHHGWRMPKDLAEVLRSAVEEDGLREA